MTSLSVPGGHFRNVSGSNAGKEKGTLVADCLSCICTALGRKPPRVRTWHQYQYQSPAIQRPPPSLALSIANLEISIADHIRSIVAFKLLEIGKFIPVFGKGFIVIVCEMEIRVNDLFQYLLNGAIRLHYSNDLKQLSQTFCCCSNISNIYFSLLAFLPLLLIQNLFLMQMLWNFLVCLIFISSHPEMFTDVVGWV